MLPYGRQHIDEEDIQSVIDVLKGDYLTTGPTIEKFEDKLCQVTGAKYAVACANGTVALHMACIEAGLGPGDTAIVPSITFLATANAVRYCGADVIFADVCPQTGLMTCENLNEALDKAKSKNANVKAVLPVHLTGRAVDLDGISKMTQNHDIKIIADSCHAIGGEYNARPIGACAYEHMSTFSFHPVKTIAMGEGGAVTTNDAQTAENMKTLRHHGMIKTPEMKPWAYEMHDLGYNYRITDMQCALGLSQLKKIDEFIKKRQEIFDMYNRYLSKKSPLVTLPQNRGKQKTGWHLYAVNIDFVELGIPREIVMASLREKGIGTQVHYTPVHTQPYYRKLYGQQELNGAQKYYEQTLSLPLFTSMNEQGVLHVTQNLIHILNSV